jgi:hypothetical protein
MESAYVKRKRMKQGNPAPFDPDTS